MGEGGVEREKRETNGEKSDDAYFKFQSTVTEDAHTYLPISLFQLLLAAPPQS